MPQTGLLRFACVLRWALVLALATGCAPGPGGPPIDWQTDHDAALARAKKAGQPVLVNFGAQWCGSCQRLASEVWPHSKVQIAAARFVAVHVDVTDDKNAAAIALTQRYGIESLPAVVFLNASGTLLDKPKVMTYLSPAAMRRMLQSIE